MHTAHRIRNPNTYLSWLPVSDRKGMPDFSIYEHTGLRNGLRGLAIPEYREIHLYIAGHAHADEPELELAQTIAHEHRHAQQFSLGLNVSNTGEIWPRLLTRYHEQEAYTIYLSYIFSEFDAERYVQRTVRGGLNEAWWSYLAELKKGWFQFI